MHRVGPRHTVDGLDLEGSILFDGVIASCTVKVIRETTGCSHSGSRTLCPKYDKGEWGGAVRKAGQERGGGGGNHHGGGDGPRVSGEPRDTEWSSRNLVVAS